MYNVLHCIDILKNIGLLYYIFVVKRVGLLNHIVIVMTIGLLNRIVIVEFCIYCVTKKNGDFFLEKNNTIKSKQIIGIKFRHPLCIRMLYR